MPYMLPVCAFDNCAVSFSHLFALYNCHNLI